MGDFRQKLIRGLNFLLFLSIGGVLLYFAFRGIDFSGFWGVLVSARYEWLVLSLVAGIASNIVRAARWNLLIMPIGYRPRLSDTFYSLMTGYLANYAFPRIGEITRCAALNRTSRIPVDKLLGTVLAERAIDFLMLVILLFAVFFARLDFFGSFIQEKVFLPTYETMEGAFLSRPALWVVTGFLLLSSGAAVVIFRNRIFSLRGMGKVKDIIKGILTGLRSVLLMKDRGKFLVYTLLIWILYFLMTWVVFFTIPATSGLGVVDGLFILVFGSIGMTLPVQGGIGTYHLLVALGLSLYGISRENGLVYAIISHESQTLMILVLGGISMFLVFFGKRKHSQL